ncbi:hypothetical protein BDV37DRAFT_280397 [Aspergillus pseudonomiae]|uniref:Uncharacterized protein n=1 Tax=Aspergillus pseudonomiae TaxID=1506151 RepID=A0A5N7DL05_9EURO|nr:uncharacterized protein BDV37DRAFT_280397 [Aspergillus pseudonomiae]KAE8407141.1 hypothetical protein BDV37DRAFT_280397 [Aspergillus pseudonomiae]
MEISVARHLADCVLNACARAQAGGKELLEDDIFDENDDIKQDAIRLLKFIQGSQNRADRVATETSKIVLHPALEPYINKWGGKPQIFGSDNSDISSGTKIPFLVRIFRLACNTKESVVEKVRSRFYYVFWYRVYQFYAKEIGTHHDIYTAISICIVQGGLSEFTEEKIRGELVRWVKYGERFELLVRDLGSERVLFLLPFEYGEIFWLEKVPKSSGQRRDNLIRSLHDRLHNTEDEANQTHIHNIATAVLRYHLDSMKDEFDMPYILSICTASRKRKYRGRGMDAKANKVHKRTHNDKFYDLGKARLQNTEATGSVVNAQALQNQHYCLKSPTVIQVKDLSKSSQTEQALSKPQRTVKSLDTMGKQSREDAGNAHECASRDTSRVSHLDTLSQSGNQDPKVYDIRKDIEYRSSEAYRAINKDFSITSRQTEQSASASKNGSDANITATPFASFTVNTPNPGDSNPSYQPYFDPSIYMESVPETYNNILPSLRSSKSAETPQITLDMNGAPQLNASTDSAQSLPEGFFDPSSYMRAAGWSYNGTIGASIDQSIFIRDLETASRDTSQINTTDIDYGQVSQGLTEKFFDPSFYYMRAVDTPYDDSIGHSIYPMRDIQDLQNTSNANDALVSESRASVGATQGISESFFDPSSYMKAAQQVYNGGDLSADSSGYEQGARPILYSNDWLLPHGASPNHTETRTFVAHNSSCQNQQDLSAC